MKQMRFTRQCGFHESRDLLKRVKRWAKVFFLRSRCSSKSGRRTPCQHMAAIGKRGGINEKEGACIEIKREQKEHARYARSERERERERARAPVKRSIRAELRLAYGAISEPSPPLLCTPLRSPPVAGLPAVRPERRRARSTRSVPGPIRAADICARFERS